MLNNANILEILNQYFDNDQVYAFMNPIKGTPAYWKKFKSEVLAMVKQLVVRTFFLTLSSADLRWKELIVIIQKFSRHFQDRVELFSKVFIIDGPLGKSKYYAMRVEFQIGGKPHIHSYIDRKCSKTFFRKYR